MSLLRYAALTAAASVVSQLITAVTIVAVTIVVVVAMATAYPDRDPITRWIATWKGNPPPRG